MLSVSGLGFSIHQYEKVFFLSFASYESEIHPTVFKGQHKV